MAYITNARAVDPVDYGALLNVTFVDGVAFTSFGLSDPLWETAPAVMAVDLYVRLEDEAVIGVPEPAVGLLVLLGVAGLGMAWHGRMWRGWVG